MRKLVHKAAFRTLADKMAKAMGEETVVEEAARTYLVRQRGGAGAYGRVHLETLASVTKNDQDPSIYVVHDKLANVVPLAEAFAQQYDRRVHVYAADDVKELEV